MEKILIDARNFRNRENPDPIEAKLVEMTPDEEQQLNAFRVSKAEKAQERKQRKDAAERAEKRRQAVVDIAVDKGLVTETEIDDKISGRS